MVWRLPRHPGANDARHVFFLPSRTLNALWSGAQADERQQSDSADDPGGLARFLAVMSQTDGGGSSAGSTATGVAGDHRLRAGLLSIRRWGWAGTTRHLAHGQQGGDGGLGGDERRRQIDLGGPDP